MLFSSRRCMAEAVIVISPITTTSSTFMSGMCCLRAADGDDPSFPFLAGIIEDSVGARAVEWMGGVPLWSPVGTGGAFPTTNDKQTISSGFQHTQSKPTHPTTDFQLP